MIGRNSRDMDVAHPAEFAARRIERFAAKGKVKTSGHGHILGVQG
jgi:hypothetical protein